MAEAKTKTAQKAAAPKKTAAAKPAAKKTVATAALADAPAKTTSKTTAKPAAKRATSKKAALVAPWNPGNEERYNMIQVAAYYLAERDNFAGSPVDYWIAAEAQVSTMLSKK